MADRVVNGLAGRLLHRIVFDLLISERFIAHGSLLLGKPNLGLSDVYIASGWGMLPVAASVGGMTDMLEGRS